MILPATLKIKSKATVRRSFAPAAANTLRCSGGFAADDTSVYGDRRFRNNGGGVPGGGGGGGGTGGGGGGYNNYENWEMNNNNNNMRGGGGNNSAGGMYNDDYGGPANQAFYPPQPQPQPPPPPPQMMGGGGGPGNQGPPMRPLIDSYNPSPSSQTQQVRADSRRPLHMISSTSRLPVGNNST